MPGQLCMGSHTTYKIHRCLSKKFIYKKFHDIFLIFADLIIAILDKSGKLPGSSYIASLPNINKVGIGSKICRFKSFEKSQIILYC